MKSAGSDHLWMWWGVRRRLIGGATFLFCHRVKKDGTVGEVQVTEWADCAKCKKHFSRAVYGDDFCQKCRPDHWPDGDFSRALASE